MASAHPSDELPEYGRPGAGPSVASAPLYDAAFERDACGVGFAARVDGTPSHEIVRLGLQAVANLSHRGAMDADGKSGDGAGILTQLPRRLLARESVRLGFRQVDPDRLGIAMVFLPREAAGRAEGREIVERNITLAGAESLGWRDVPVDSSALGQKAAITQPHIAQFLFARPEGIGVPTFERALYLARKRIEAEAATLPLNDLYLPSLSCRTVVYKGLMVATQLPLFYRDLADRDFESAIALFHQRYSTNTFPNWLLAQPFRFLAHNGEINTLQGNRNWMRAREGDLRSEIWGSQSEELCPVLWGAGSDSAMLDNAFELSVQSGRSLPHTLMMMVPEAWENDPDADPDLRAFYHYHSALTEPWDGPAALAFSDGTVVGAALDRNGLRPLRYKVTSDGLVVAASEVGAVDIDERTVVEKGRLGPGQMLVVDTSTQHVLHNASAKADVVRGRQYRQWIKASAVTLEDISAASTAPAAPDMGRPLLQSQTVFGFHAEELKFVIEPMAMEGKEPTWSMGDDAPLAVLSRQTRALSNYFRQRFAQVTNPPIDPLRESLVMSLQTYLGPRRSLLTETEEHCRLVNLQSPVLDEYELAALRSDVCPLQTATLAAVFSAADGDDGIPAALSRLARDAESAIEAGATLLVISDRSIGDNLAPIPALLAVSFVHQHLIRQGKRLRADLIIDTGDLWEVHQLALLIGYGAGAVCPYLAWQTVESLAAQAEMDVQATRLKYRQALEAGLLKIMSKMGISTVSSYRGAQIFEALGLSADLVEYAFPGTPTRIGGIGLEQIGQDALRRHSEAFGDNANSRLRDQGHYRFRREGEYHGYNPFVVKLLQTAARSGEYADYKQYSDLVNNRLPVTLRDLMRFRQLGEPVAIDEVESVESIRTRFTAQAMSLGALSPEAHQTISIAMNRIGGRSNTGEGGEDPDYYRVRPGGDSPDNKVKQVASGRFGVTAEYLAHAAELEIKMAQGSKPGEGGQLPAHKVSELIARFRRTIAGVPLISPPPHHDIYSIEDLAQLIYDLKQVNPTASIGVKLVSEAGVGTVAAGVAKAGANYILISGQDGGTGASPLGSIKFAGCPWELGLAETQQVLVLNDLRSRVRVRVDGGLKTGRDVVLAAMLGAEEFGFATGVVVAIGCDMARQCHLNTCPTGIATQREDLRRKFAGSPENVINYLTLVAQEVRETLASIGARTLVEVVGRSDLLERFVPETPTSSPKWQKVDLNRITAGTVASEARRRHQADQPHPAGDLNQRIVRDASRAVETRKRVRLRYPIRNSDRTVGATLGGIIGKRYGQDGLPSGTIEIALQGSAGQSFGAFAASGMTMSLVGEANDYVAKGLSGGVIAIRPPARAQYEWHEQVIAGNTVLYGATGGSLFLAGRAGERFAVRNSGAVGVAEGVGDHACEYMTAGRVVVLGETGRNFGAGMSAGLAYVLDESGDFPERVNNEMVSVQRLDGGDDADELLGLIKRHLEATDSPRAAEIVSSWDAFAPKFWKVVPHPPITLEDRGTVLARHSKAP